MPYANLFYELTNWCNGSCLWCPRSESKKDHARKYVKPHVFYTTLSDLLLRGLIGRKTIFHLFNFSEPFLHPDINSIIGVLNNLDLGYSFNTNGSVPVKLNKEADLKNLRSLIFSMPGFSQDSYDRMHGFNFNTIAGNIAQLICDYRRLGFIGYSQIAYHVYQFNLHVVKHAKEFAEAIGHDCIGLGISATFHNPVGHLMEPVNMETEE